MTDDNIFLKQRSYDFFSASENINTNCLNFSNNISLNIQILIWRHMCNRRLSSVLKL